MHNYPNHLQTIGNTPLVKLSKIIPNTTCTILAKLENQNLGNSIKTRIALAMIETAEQHQQLTPQMQIIEPTSGNTGIALAMIGASKNYPVTLTMPENMSKERQKILKAFGAKIILTPAKQGMQGSINKANQLVAQNPNHYYMPQQFSNPANPAIHKTTTAPEIWHATQGKVDIIIAGVGTGGTITGISQYLKQKNKNLITIAVEPKESPIISQHLSNQPLTPSPHPIQGIGAGFIPDNLDLNIIDQIIQIDGATAIQITRKLAQTEGILCGISSGAALAAASQIAQNPKYQKQTIIVILPDSGERYLSTNLYQNN